MKHWLILGTLAALIAWLVLKPSDLDKLSKRPSAAALAQMTIPAGNIFVSVNPARLPVTPSYFSVPGRVTIVVFHDATCPATREMDRNLEDFNRLRPDVAIRKVSITLNGNAYYKAIRDYRWNIFLMPSVLIYDQRGKLVEADEKTNFEGTRLLDRWMQREAEHAAEPG